MPAWLIGLLISFGVKIVTSFGIPYLEEKFPYLVPLLDDILKVVTEKAIPHPSLEKMAVQYKAECTGTACPPDLKT